MTRTTTGHPTRAFAGLLAALLAWEGARLPALRDSFVRELAMARAARDSRDRATRGAVVMARAMPTRPPARTEVVAPLASDATSMPVVPPTPTVIPAKAGTHHLSSREMGSRFRGNDGGAFSNVAAKPAGAPLAPAGAPLAVVGDARFDVVAPAAWSFATAAYARLAAGDRRNSARLLDAAALIGGDPRARAWARDRDALRRRWSGSAYVIARRTGDLGIAGTPVLGGGQTGAAIAFTPDPLARRPVSLTLRDFAAASGTGIDRDTAQAAIGLSWQFLPGLRVSAERMILLNAATRGAWSARVAGGGSARRFGIDATAYAEAGIVGSATYAAAQARTDLPVTLGRFALHPGAGAWASIQHDVRRVSRVDAGPGLRIGHVALPVELSVDYRFRVAGNAAPGSGPVLTLSTSF